jgi:spore coat polysaccharide biosynthesis protein SpsF (cytidylyltransferase family)
VILGIVQARMGSTRLPGKAMKKVAGIPLVDLVLARCLRSRLMDKVVVSTTGHNHDVAIKADFREPMPRDPLGGFYACAKHFGADIAVRITADDPLKDPELIDEAIGYLLSKPVEFVSNTIKPTYPRGLDVEVIRIKTLKYLHETMQDDVYREHITYYITEHPKEFKTYNFKYGEDLSAWNWSIDNPEDLVKMNELLSNFDPVKVGYQEVINFVKAGGKRAKVHRGGVVA